MSGNRSDTGHPVFLSTPSARRATHASRRTEVFVPHFYPRPPRGGRHLLGNIGVNALVFLSTPSARRATESRPRSNSTPSFLSTPSARRATVQRDLIFCSVCISIHALREEGDREACPYCHTRLISIHALREEGDHFFASSKIPVGRFLSTPSARRATVHREVPGLVAGISIHALREEGDQQERRG